MENRMIDTPNNVFCDEAIDTIKTVKSTIEDILYKTIERFGINKENIEEFHTRLRVELYVSTNYRYRYDVYLDNVKVAFIYVVFELKEIDDQYIIDCTYTAEYI